MQEMLPSEREDSHDDNASAVVMLWIDKKEAYRVYDRFDESELQILEDGNFLVHLDYKMDDWVYGMILQSSGILVIPTFSFPPRINNLPK